MDDINKKTSSMMNNENSVQIDKKDTDKRSVKRWSLSSNKYEIFFFQFVASTLIVTILGYPQGLQTNLISPPYNFSNFEYGLFYGVSSLPNIILPLFAGIYLDKYGYNLYMIIALEALIIIGSIIVTIGTYHVSYATMVVGQLLMGSGCENLQLLIKRFVLKIASKQESVSLFGILLLAVRIGSLLSSFIPPLLFYWTESVPFCFLVVTFITIVICLFFKISFYMSENTDYGSEDEEEMRQNLISESPSLLLQLKAFFLQTDLMFWLAITLVYTNFMMIYGFISEANNFISEAVNVNCLEASYFLIYYSILAGIMQTLSGFLFARIGYYVYALIIGVLFQISASFLFIEIFGSNKEFMMLLPLSFMAIGYSLGTTFIFSSLGFIVERKFYGVAYGLLQCGIDFGGVFGSILFGYIKDVTLSQMEGYFWPFIEIAGFQILNLIIAVVMIVLDRATIKILSKKKKST